MLQVPAWLPPGGAVGLLLFAVFMVLRGWIVPGRLHNLALQRIDKLEKTIDKKDAQIDELMELTRTAVAVIQALPQPPRATPLPPPRVGDPA